MSRNDELLIEEEAAAYLRQAPTTLRQWRHLRKGPAWVKVGKRALYRRSDLEAYVNERRVDPSARAEGEG